MSENSKKFRCVVKKIPTATGALILPNADASRCSAAVLQQILRKTIEAPWISKLLKPRSNPRELAQLALPARPKSLLQILDPLRAFVKIMEISRDLEKAEQAYGGSAPQRWQADKN